MKKKRSQTFCLQYKKNRIRRQLLKTGKLGMRVIKKQQLRFYEYVYTYVNELIHVFIYPGTWLTCSPYRGVRGSCGILLVLSEITKLGNSNFMN